MKLPRLIEKLQLLRSISSIVWIVTSHSEGESARDGSENARNSIVAGFAEAKGADLLVLISQDARNLADQEGKAHYFTGKNDCLKIVENEFRKKHEMRGSPPPAVGATQGFIDFTPLLSSATQDFVGRNWLISEVDKFLDDHDRGYVVVRGLPGMGKSALLSQLVKTRRWVHHFNSHWLGITKFEQFLLGLRAQLIDRYEFDLDRPRQEDLSNGLFLRHAGRSRRSVGKTRRADDHRRGCVG
jgi:hypothetical protein